MLPRNSVEIYQADDGFETPKTVFAILCDIKPAVCKCDIWG